MSDELGILVNSQDWENGLRCVDCHHQLEEGDRYSERLVAMTEDGTPMVEIVCVVCALGIVNG